MTVDAAFGLRAAPALRISLKAGALALKVSRYGNVGKIQPAFRVPIDLNFSLYLLSDMRAISKWGTAPVGHRGRNLFEVHSRWLGTLREVKGRLLRVALFHREGGLLTLPRLFAPLYRLKAARCAGLPGTSLRMVLLADPYASVDIAINRSCRRGEKRTKEERGEHH
jgi:hypothetical protein